MGWKTKEEKKEYDRKKYELRKLKEGKIPKTKKSLEDLNKELEEEKIKYQIQQKIRDEKQYQIGLGLRKKISFNKPTTTIEEAIDKNFQLPLSFNEKKIEIPKEQLVPKEQLIYKKNPLQEFKIQYRKVCYRLPVIDKSTASSIVLVEPKHLLKFPDDNDNENDSDEDDSHNDSDDEDLSQFEKERQLMNYDSNRYYDKKYQFYIDITSDYLDKLNDKIDSVIDNVKCIKKIAKIFRHYLDDELEKKINIYPIRARIIAYCLYNIIFSDLYNFPNTTKEQIENYIETL